MGTQQRDDLIETIEDIAGQEPAIVGDSSTTTNLPQTRQKESWLDAEPSVVEDMLARRGENRSKLLSWINANLKESVDYVVIKGRRSMGKPGAEKVAGMLGLQCHWPDLNRELERLRAGADTIFLACELLRDGVVQAQGAGARDVASDDGDWNKAIKMAKKSAMIDAVLNVGGLSEVFTQDLDDTNYDAAISEEGQTLLLGHAKALFPDNHEQVLESLARRAFNFDDGDWTRIPAFRFHDALRRLSEKAEEFADEREPL